MAAHHIHSVVVPGHGIVTDLELTAALDGAVSTLTAAGLARPAPILERTATLERAAAVLHEGCATHALVVEGSSRRPLGVLSTLDLANALAFGRSPQEGSVGGPMPGRADRAETCDVSQIEPRTCTLRLVAQGQEELCPRERCALWEPGGAVVEGNCLVERLGVDVRRPELAAYLLETRERLEQARDLAEAEEAHREFSRRLGRDV